MRHRNRSQNETRVPNLHSPVQSCESSVGLSHFGFGTCVSLFDPASVPGRQWLRLLCLTVCISLGWMRSRRLSWCWRWFL